MPRSRRMLEPSKLATQLELLKSDLDLDSVKLVTKGRTFQFSESIIAGEVDRTIEGASTVKLTVNDYHRAIRNSGMLGAEVDIKIDGLWFRLVAVSKSGNDLELTFESREVAILRTFDKKRVVGWDQMTRTRFVQILMNEAPETRAIPFVCPELTMKAPSSFRDEDTRATERDYGYGARKGKGGEKGKGTVPPDSLTVKGVPATKDQIRVLQDVLDQGTEQISLVNQHRRKILVCSIMTVIQESTAHNLPFGDKPGWTGAFQQNPIFGWPASGVVKTDAKAFFEKAIAEDAKQPKLEYWELCQAVQRSKDGRLYAQWRKEAEKWVTAYGVIGDDSESDTATSEANLQLAWEQDATEFQFARGNPKTLPGGRKGWKKEDTWTCLQRLAEEVNWRAFEVSGKVYFISETRLFKSAPRARISEDSEGVDWIDFNYDVGKSTASISISGRADRWAAPPGSTIEIFDNGPVNGRWLVTDIRRGIFDTSVNITAKKPRAKLPEPIQEDDLGGLWDNALNSEPETTDREPSYKPKPGKYPTGAKLRDAVLNNPRITFKTDVQRSDVQFSQVDERVLVFLLAFTDASFVAEVSSLKTGHSVNVKGTTRRSAHADGRAVDLGNFTLGSPDTEFAMNWILDARLDLGIAQLIGPIDAKCYPPTLAQNTQLMKDHDNHIHVGWAPK